MLALPEILTDEKYKDTWEWDDWKPKAKLDAPEEVKSAIQKFVDEAEDEGDDDTLVLK